jgi:hypothetical protein
VTKPIHNVLRVYFLYQPLRTYTEITYVMHLQNFSVLGKTEYAPWGKKEAKIRACQNPDSKELLE